MNCACMSVGKPGIGRGRDRRRSGALRRADRARASSPVSTSAPACLELREHGAQVRRRPARRLTSPPVIAAAARNVPASIRSAIIVGSARVKLAHAVRSARRGCRRPRSRAPMATRKSRASPISGSHAAFSITVRPSAGTAAIRMFPVAPTLEIVERRSSAPRSPSRAGDDVAVLDLDLGAELLHALDVQIDRARPPGAAAGEADARRRRSARGAVPGRRSRRASS